MRTSLERGTISTPGRINDWNGPSWEQDRSTAQKSGQRSVDWLPQDNVRPACGATDCRRMGSFWRKTGRPVFEGRWACSRECLTRLVEAAVWQEMGDGEASASLTSHRHRVPLGLVLLAQGAITQLQLQRALAVQKDEGHGRIGEWLVKICDVPEEKVTRALSVQWNCPVLPSAGFDPRAMALVMPKALRDELNVLPLRVAAGSILYLGAEEQIDASAAFALECMTGLKVESGVMSASDFIGGVAGLEDQIVAECREMRVKDSGTVVEILTSYVMRAQPIASRVVRLRDSIWARLWLERGAIGRNGMLPTTGEDVVDLLFRLAQSHY